MLAYAVHSKDLSGDFLGDCVEVFVRREDAERFVQECLTDEPDWESVLSVVQIELGGEAALRPSMN